MGRLLIGRDGIVRERLDAGFTETALALLFGL